MCVVLSQFVAPSTRPETRLEGAVVNSWSTRLSNISTDLFHMFAQNLRHVCKMLGGRGVCQSQVTCRTTWLGGDELNLGQVVTLLTCVKGNKSLKLLRSFQSGHVRNGPKPTNQGIDNVTYRAAGKLKTVILVSISSFQISKLKVHFGNIWIEWSRCKFQSPHPCFYCTYILSQNLFYAFKLGTFHNKTGFWCRSSIKGPVLKASKHIH